MRIRPLSALLAIPLLASAQQTSKRQPTTTVTGHVYCADTNAPARLASVMLEPVRAVDEAGSVTHQKLDGERIMMTAVQTTLDGSFSIPKVAAGTYYVIAYKPGYLSPLATFPADVLSHPSEDDRKRIAVTVPRITVEAGLPASIDIRLDRGAAISGTVLFDDGSPASDLAVHALIRRKQGQKETWSALRPTPFGMMAEVRTDDLGHYRLIGLPPREYTVQVDLELQKLDFGMVIGESWNSRSDISITRLPFYSGSTVRQRDAMPFKLIASDERTGEDITIPLAKLHTVAGELIAAHDGHLLNYGAVSLRNADDQSEVAAARVDYADSKFHFIFIPEGDYILHITDTGDASYEEIPNPPGYMEPTSVKSRLLRHYGTTDQPLTVHDDVSNLTISVPGRGKPEPTQHATASQ